MAQHFIHLIVRLGILGRHPQDTSEHKSTFSKPSAELLDNGKNRPFKGYGTILYIYDLASGDSWGAKRARLHTQLLTRRVK